MLSFIPWPKIQFPSLQISTFGKTKGYRFSTIPFGIQADYPSDSLRFNAAKLRFPVGDKIFTFGHENIDSNQSNPSNVRKKN